MRAEIDQANSTAGSFDQLLDRHRRNRLITSSQAADEDRWIAAAWALMLQIVGQRLPGLHRQRQDVLAQRLRTSQRHCPSLPINVADHETSDFSGAQAHVERAAGDRIAELW